MKEEFSSTHSTNGSYALIHDIFKVTKKNGIIYMDNTDRLASSSDLISLEVLTPIGTVINITVTMTGSARQIKDEETCGKIFKVHR